MRHLAYANQTSNITRQVAELYCFGLELQIGPKQASDSIIITVTWERCMEFPAIIEDRLVSLMGRGGTLRTLASVGFTGIPRLANFSDGIDQRLNAGHHVKPLPVLYVGMRPVKTMYCNNEAMPF